MQHSWILQRFS